MLLAKADRIGEMSREEKNMKLVSLFSVMRFPLMIENFEG
jgi:hypothetical protein